MFTCCCFEEPMVYHARSTASSPSTASTSHIYINPRTFQKIKRKILKPEIESGKNEKKGSIFKVCKSYSMLFKIEEQ